MKCFIWDVYSSDAKYEIDEGRRIATDNLTLTLKNIVSIILEESQAKSMTLRKACIKRLMEDNEVKGVPMQTSYRLTLPISG